MKYSIVWVSSVVIKRVVEGFVFVGSLWAEINARKKMYVLGWALSRAINFIWILSIIHILFELNTSITKYFIFICEFESTINTKEK